MDSPSISLYNEFPGKTNIITSANARSNHVMSHYLLNDEKTTWFLCSTINQIKRQNYVKTISKPSNPSYYNHDIPDNPPCLLCFPIVFIGFSPPVDPDRSSTSMVFIFKARSGMPLPRPRKGRAHGRGTPGRKTWSTPGFGRKTPRERHGKTMLEKNPLGNQWGIVCA